MLVGTFEIFELVAVKEGNEIWDGADTEGHGAVADLRCVDGSEDKIWIFIGFCSTLEYWLNSHAWWT